MFKNMLPLGYTVTRKRYVRIIITAARHGNLFENLTLLILHPLEFI